MEELCWVFPISGDWWKEVLMDIWNYWWNFRIIKGATLKLCWHHTNMWVPIRVGKCLSMMDCKTEGIAHRRLRNSISYKGESIWIWRNTSSALGKTGRVLAQRLSRGLHSYCLVLVPLFNWFIFALQELFGSSNLILGANGIFWVFCSFWSTELLGCLCSVSINDFDLSHIYVSIEILRGTSHQVAFLASLNPPC